MTRDEARQYILNNPQIHLKPDKSGEGYICPLCGNGSGSTGTGLRKHKEHHWKCFKCGFYGDMVELIAQEYGISDGGSGEAFEIARKVYSIEITERAVTRVQETKNEQEGFKDYFERCIANLDRTDYLTRRGINLDTIRKKCIVGFDSHFKGTDGEWKAVIFPISKYGFVARNTDPNADKDHRYKIEGEIGTYNKQFLSTCESVYVVEGAVDALSIVEAGGNAVALNSTGNVKAFLRQISDMILETDSSKELKTMNFYIALDDDSAGWEASVALHKGLSGLGLKAQYTDISGDYKDANEALINDKTAFIKRVSEHKEPKTKPEQYLNERDSYISNTSASQLDSFIEGIWKSRHNQIIPTGFPKLDEALGGGLMDGLYFIGAASSLGKTTFALQIADQIAKNGHDVLIISLEMARSELMGRSISRITYEIADNKNDAKTELGITNGARYSSYNQREIDLIKESIERYRKYADRLTIIEGVGNLNAIGVRDTVEKHIRFTGKKPVVIVDYVQILSPFKDGATDKTNMDLSVTELKRISRDAKIPVIGISSFNRDSYMESVSMSSFKESGAIEYSADVLIGLQRSCMENLITITNKGNDKPESDNDRKKRLQADIARAEEDERNGKPRMIQLKLLKNRKGAKGSVFFEYRPMFNIFRECKEQNGSRK